MIMPMLMFVHMAVTVFVLMLVTVSHSTMGVTVGMRMPMIMGARACVHDRLSYFLLDDGCMDGVNFGLILLFNHSPCNATTA